MILACDVHYHGDDSATVAGILFDGWGDAVPAKHATQTVVHVEPYQPGAFYKRELPCLLALIKDLPASPSTVVIDGYVTLGPDRRPGLGAHLFDALGEAVPVIGVAKTPFRGTPRDAELLRGASKTPLYVSAAGLPLAVARAHIAAMHGPYRLPTLLGMVDRLCRGTQT